jgi:hypothetical protein
MTEAGRPQQEVCLSVSKTHGLRKALRSRFSDPKKSGKDVDGCPESVKAVSCFLL